jgi:Tol biopolymer transport system component
MPKATSIPVTSESTPARDGRIAFASDRDGNWEIYVMNADGSGQRNLTANPSKDRAPAWSPDFQRIAFSSDRSKAASVSAVLSHPNRRSEIGTGGLIPGGFATSLPRGENWEIYLMHADGSGQINLTNNSATDEYPAWSPDGKRIAFVSNRDLLEDIYVMNADGSNVTRLTENDWGDGGPTWSPDGTRIAYASEHVRGEAGWDWDLYVMNADGSGMTRLLKRPGLDLFPAWSPDGNRIAFTCKSDSELGVCVINADGTGWRRLSDDVASDQHPSWSSDGRYIVFSSARTGNWEIYVMNPDGSGQVRLTTSDASDGQPSWSSR